MIPAALVQKLVFQDGDSVVLGLALLQNPPEFLGGTCMGVMNLNA